MSASERYGNRIPSEREHRVIELVAEGLKNKEVADAIGTTEHVVKNYLRVIYDKLGLWNLVELALWYESRRGVSTPALMMQESTLVEGVAARLAAALIVQVSFKQQKKIIGSRMPAGCAGVRQRR